MPLARRLQQGTARTSAYTNAATLEEHVQLQASEDTRFDSQSEHTIIYGQDDATSSTEVALRIQYEESVGGSQEGQYAKSAIASLVALQLLPRHRSIETIDDVQSPETIIIPNPYTRNENLHKAISKRDVMAFRDALHGLRVPDLPWFGCMELPGCGMYYCRPKELT